MAGLAAPFKEALLAAVVALLLAVPLVGFQTVQPLSGEGLDLHARWSWVAIAVAAVFAGRFLIASVLEHRRRRAPILATPTPGRGFKTLRFEGERARVLRRVIQLLALGAAISLPMWANRYVLEVGILVATYVMLGWGLNIVVGLAGLLDLGYVAFYAVGAYSFALFAMHFNASFWECLPLAGLLAATFGVLLGFPVLRLRGDYLAIVTLGFGEMIRIVLINWFDLTNGPNGIGNIPRPTFFGLPFAASAPNGGATFHSFFGLEYSTLHRQAFLFYVILALALLTNAFTLRMRRLPIGRAWEALREDEIACRSLGINPTNTKLTAFAIGAMFGGFAGCFFATRQGFISPESFTFIESAIILAIVVLGGMGSQIGVVIAAIVLIGGPELVRGLAEYRMLAFGGLMVLIMVIRPTGLVGFRQPTIHLKDHPPPDDATPVLGRAPG
ncbi:MAG: high-affinity branched-chain amino acid ABC transporter permease LivM [Rhodospirillales bacterium]